MADLWDHQEPRSALAAIARDFHGRGWMAGTAGNLSARIDADSFWITASGYPKGRLTPKDFVRVAVTGGDVLETCQPQDRPSAETTIHQVIYQRYPTARAVLHVHTATAVLAVDRHAPPQAETLALPALEMIKGMGIWDELPNVALPLFDNWRDVPRIAQEIARRFAAAAPDISALMIRRHGLTVWGDTLQQAYDRLEIMEFILNYLAISTVTRE